MTLKKASLYISLLMVLLVVICIGPMMLFTGCSKAIHVTVLGKQKVPTIVVPLGTVDHVSQIETYNNRSVSLLQTSKGSVPVKGFHYFVKGDTAEIIFYSDMSRMLRIRPPSGDSQYPHYFCKIYDGMARE